MCKELTHDPLRDPNRFQALLEEYADQASALLYPSLLAVALGISFGMMVGVSFGGAMSRGKTTSSPSEEGPPEAFPGSP